MATTFAEKKTEAADVRRAAELIANAIEDAENCRSDVDFAASLDGVIDEATDLLASLRALKRAAERDALK